MTIVTSPRDYKRLKAYQTDGEDQLCDSRQSSRLHDLYVDMYVETERTFIVFSLSMYRQIKIIREHLNENLDDR